MFLRSPERDAATICRHERGAAVAAGSRAGLPKVYERYNTVEKLFAAIRRSLSFGKYRMVVRYDADLGYPVVADLDPRFEVADDELVLKVTEFRVIAERLEE